MTRENCQKAGSGGAPYAVSDPYPTFNSSHLPSGLLTPFESALLPDEMSFRQSRDRHGVFLASPATNLERAPLLEPNLAPSYFFCALCHSSTSHSSSFPRTSRIQPDFSTKNRVNFGHFRASRSRVCFCVNFVRVLFDQRNRQRRSLLHRLY